MKIEFGEPSRTPWGRVWIVPIYEPVTTGVVIGVDPGRNYGVSVIHETFISVLGGRFPDKNKPEVYGEIAFDMMADLTMPADRRAVVEGASHRSHFYNVGIDYIRMGFYLGLVQRHIPVVLVPPMTIRKAVFGNGKIKASSIWKSINPNAADSLAIAMYAAGVVYEGEIND